MSEDRSHAPTQRRRRQALEQGRAPRSAELSSAVVYLGAIAAIVLFSPRLFDYLLALLERQLTTPVASSSFPDQVSELQATGMQSLVNALPVFAMLGVVAVMVQLTQMGFLWLPHKVLPDVGRLNPASRIQRLFSPANWASLLLQSLKVVALVTASFFVMKQLLPQLLQLSATAPEFLLSKVAGLLLQFATALGAVLLVFGVIDYALQKLKFERDLQMSPEEVREEIRAIQNDVSLARRRRLQTGYPSTKTDQAGEGAN